MIIISSAGKSFRATHLPLCSCYHCLLDLSVCVEIRGRSKRGEAVTTEELHYGAFQGKQRSHELPQVACILPAQKQQMWMG